MSNEQKSKWTVDGSETPETQRIKTLVDEINGIINDIDDGVLFVMAKSNDNSVIASINGRGEHIINTIATLIEGKPELQTILQSALMGAMLGAISDDDGSGDSETE